MAFPEDSIGGSSRQLWDYTFNTFSFSASVSPTPTAGVVTNITTLTGKGIVSNLQMVLSGTSVQAFMVVIIIDGVSYDIGATTGSAMLRPIFGGAVTISATAANVQPQNISIDVNIKFKTSFTLALRNLTGANTSISSTIQFFYHT